MSDLFSRLHRSYGEASASAPGTVSSMTALGEWQAEFEVAPGSESGGGTPVLTTPCKLESFSVYWDGVNKQYKLYNPMVVVGTGSISVDTPPSLSQNATYYCIVEAQKDEDGKPTGSYSAKVVTESTSPDAVLAVKICTVGDAATFESVQYHTGAIIYSGGSATTIFKAKAPLAVDEKEFKVNVTEDTVLTEGATTVMLATSAINKVDSDESTGGYSQVTAKNNTIGLKGHESCGLEVVPDTIDPPVLQVRIRDYNDGLGTGEMLRIRTFKAGDTDVAKVFATRGVTFKAGDDTNIVFTEKKDDEGKDTGEITVDVYYK